MRKYYVDYAGVKSCNCEKGVNYSQVSRHDY